MTDRTANYHGLLEMQSSVIKLLFRVLVTISQGILIKTIYFVCLDVTIFNKAENILITGSTDVGNSYLATSLGHQAYTEGYRVLYFNVDNQKSLIITSQLPYQIRVQTEKIIIFGLNKIVW